MTERVLDMHIAQSPGADVKARKTRASKPKVKTGCQTCKIRRVKCDETKPNCLRCLKFGHQCDGYISKPTSKPNSPSNGSRLLVPKSASSSSSSSSKISNNEGKGIQSPAKIYPSPTTPLFRTPHEHAAFTTFCSSTSRRLSSPLSTDLWSRLMLQACETSPSIRHAVISLGALNLSPTPPTSENSVGTLRHQFAFRQYSKALCLLRRDSHDLRTTLISSLLFYCFESFHGYHELAISQVYTGLNLIRECASSFYSPRPSGREIEEDILRAFGSLEIQVMLYADGRTREAHEHYRRSGQGVIDSMPVVFSSLEEAREVLEMVIRRSMHWLRSTMHLHTFFTPPRDEKCNSGGLFFDVDPSFAERLTTLAEYSRWNNAFTPLLNHARSRSSPHSTFILASTLRLHWLAGYMSIASNNSRSALVNNPKHTLLLQELVEIARRLLGEEGEGWVFDMQIIVPLLTVGWIYRHRSLRREAISLLLRSPRKEGVWDGIVVGKIMNWLNGVEEDAVREAEPSPSDSEGGESEGRWEVGKVDEEEEGDEYVPEWAAARCIRMQFDAERREASVSCLQPVRGGGEVRREVVIPW